MGWKLLLIWCWAAAAAAGVGGARIFGVFVFPAYSHSTVFRRVYEELALRGHEVVVATTDPGLTRPIPTLTEIDISFAYDAWRTRKDRINLSANPTGKQMMQTDFEILLEITEQMLQMPEIQNILVNKTNYFDVVLTEWLFPGTFAFGKKLNCPLIGISSMDLLPIHRELAGNPTHPTYSNNFLVQLISTDLWGRIIKADFYSWLRHYFYYQLLPACDKLIEKYMGDLGAPLEEISKEVSMVIVTKNPLLSAMQPNTPIIKEVSGLQVRPPKPLPKRLRRFCDEATNGLIYFSLGSNVKSDIISERLQDIFLQAFAELPYNVLWKFEKTNFSDLPENVVVEKWLPQQDILAHPNVKVFITQGGLQSLDETLRRRVPIVGMPFFVDQPANVRRMAELGVGVHIDKTTLTKDAFKKAILEVAENPKYKQTVAKYSDLLSDEPLEPIEQAMHWIEFVIRHKGAPLLRSNYAHLPWYQYLLLDIIGLALACLLTVLALTLLSIVYLDRVRRYYFGSKAKSD